MLAPPLVIFKILNILKLLGKKAFLRKLVTRSENNIKGPAYSAGNDAQRIHQVIETFRFQRLGAIAFGMFRIVMYLNDKTVSTGGHSCL